MRIPFLSIFINSPFEGVQEHAEKVKECAGAFQKAMECYASKQCEAYEEYHKDVVTLESEADAIKRRIRGHLPKGTMMAVDKFQLFRYIREQDHVLDAMEDALEWISYRSEPGIPEELEKNFFLLVEAVVGPVEELSKMVTEARKYFNSFSEKQRVIVKNIIRNIRREEHEADKVEDALKRQIINMNADPVTIFHMIRLVEVIGSIADYAENSGDMMRAMISR